MATVDFLREMIDTLVEEELSPRLGKGIVRLLEGKIDMEMQRFSNNPAVLVFLRALKENNVLPKYVPWLTKIGTNPDTGIIQMEIDDVSYQSTLPNDRISTKEVQEMAKYFLDLVNRFEKLLQVNQIPSDKKDINQYKRAADLRSVILVAEKGYEAKSQEKTAKKSSDKIYEDANLLIIEPKSKEASCVYGKGTQWCISATQSQNYFDSYSEQGARFIFIINKKTGDKDAIAFAGDISEIEIYDAEDGSQKPVYIEKKYSKDILQILNDFLGRWIGKEPFNLITMDDIKLNPLLIVKNYSTFQKLTTDIVSTLDIIETLFSADRTTWSDEEKGWADTRIREGTVKAIDQLQENVYSDMYRYSARLLKINKSNPKEYPMTLTAQAILAAFFLAPQEDVYPHEILPLVLFPMESRDILTYYLSNPDANFPHLGRITGNIEKSRVRMANMLYSKTRRKWEDLINSLAVGDQDQKYFSKRRLERFKEIGDSVGWDFIGAALANVRN